MNAFLKKTGKILLYGTLLLTMACEDSVYKTNDWVENTNFTVSDSFAYEIPIVAQSQIDMETVNGTIRIITLENSDVLRITGKRCVRSESIEDARAHLELLSVNIFEGSENIFITTEQPSESQGRTYVVDYVLEMPKTMDLRLNQINGNVETDTLYGNTDVHLSNGNILLHKVYGCVKADLINGIINAAVTVPDSGYCTLKNVNGQIILAIPVTTSAFFRAAVVNGTVGVNDLVLKDLQSSTKEIKGKLGAGAGNIVCSLVNGEISVSGIGN